MYKLKNSRFEYPKETLCYDYLGYDYGLVEDEFKFTREWHKAVTLNKDGSAPFFTVPVSSLELI